MWKLRDEVIEDEGETLLDNLSHTWNHFYKELLPALQVIFCGVLPVSFKFHPELKVAVTYGFEIRFNTDTYRT
mgnify:CR=1 FL=1